MNRRIPNGAWCVWRLDPGCDGRSGTEIVLAWHRDIWDSESGGAWTVKRYEAIRDPSGDTIEEVILRPHSTDPSHRPIVLDWLVEGELIVVAELVEVLG